jgi:hypothetical protein
MSKKVLPIGVQSTSLFDSFRLSTVLTAPDLQAPAQELCEFSFTGCFESVIWIRPLGVDANSAFLILLLTKSV